VKIYFAGPLFSEAERDWLRNLKKQIELLAESQGKTVNVIWPYDLIGFNRVNDPNPVSIGIQFVIAR